MSRVTFTQLPRELRDQIWAAAAAAQYKQSKPHFSSDKSLDLAINRTKIASVNSSIAEGYPDPRETPFAERVRQAFVGYDNLPEGIEAQPLRVYIHDSHDRSRLRAGVNEFNILINLLPIATVCSEARSHAAKFCLEQIKIVNLFYAVDVPGEACAEGDELRENIFAQPKTVMVTTAYHHHHPEDGPKRFDSAEHLVDITHRVFGNCIERIILNGYYASMNSLEEFYWPHTTQTRRLQEVEPKFIDDPSHDKLDVYMTPDRTAYLKEELIAETYYDLRFVRQNLLKFHEILDAAKGRLTRLQRLELRLHTYCWDDLLLSRVGATNRDGVLWLNWSDVEIGFHHKFRGFDGYSAKDDD